MMNLLTLANEEHSRRGGTLTWDAIAAKHALPFSGNALRMRVRKLEANGKPPPKAMNAHRIKGNSEAEDLEKIIKDLLWKHFGKEKEDEPDAVLATHEPYPVHLDDTPLWTDWKATRTETIAALLYDFHIPDHSVKAVKLATALLAEIKPGVIVIGGDSFDLDALGQYDQHPRRKRGDAFKEIEKNWHGIIDGFQVAAPGAVIIAFKGNHGLRLDRYQAQQGGALYQTTEEKFVEIIRSRNRVWWLGALQETHIGALFIQHGKRFGEFAAKRALKDLGWTTPMAQGHGHRPTSYVHRVTEASGAYRVVQSITAGCLCNVPPHYQVDSQQSHWLQGMAVAHVGEVVNLQNIVFHPLADEGLCAFYGGIKVKG